MRVLGMGCIRNWTKEERFLRRMEKCDFAAGPCQDLEREHTDSEMPQPPVGHSQTGNFLRWGARSFRRYSVRSGSGRGPAVACLQRLPVVILSRGEEGGKSLTLTILNGHRTASKRLRGQEENPHTPPSPISIPILLLQTPARPIGDASATRSALAHPTRGALWAPWLL